MKIIYFGTSRIGEPILEALVREHHVLAVVTSPDKPVGRKQVITPSPIATLADKHNIPTYKPDKVKNNPELLEDLKNLNADLFVVVSYGKILPIELINTPPLKTVNVHFSLLPKYRGAAPVQFALLNGEHKTGTTIFILDELMDHGPILATAELGIDPTDTNPILQEKLAQISAELLLETLPKYQSGVLKPVEQDHSQATKTGLISKEDGKVDWSKPATEIYNKWRAYQPWPGIYTLWEDKTLKILECKVGPELTGEPGQFKDNAIICGGNTSLELISIQLEGKNAVEIEDFLRGHSNFSLQK